jgi:tryptophanyl-tRNA synthetase
MQRIVSGVQPSGHLHLGNYLGMIRPTVALQHEKECLVFMADLHAITVPQDPDALRASVLETASAFIACGINPEKSAIFPQSAVSGHAELAWIFNCHTPIGWLNRMTQFKEKSGKDKEKAPLGLYAYPVLMAADVLLYHGTHVPVGEDQKQHIELMRDIAGAFNRAVGEEYFPLPEPMILSQAARVMSLRDGTKKMSKSDSSDYARINLTDDADTIALKIRKAKSDMLEGMQYDPQTRPEASNLLTIYAALADLPRAEVEAQFASYNFSKFKEALTELAVATLSPITAEMRRLQDDQPYVRSVLQKSLDRVRPIAAQTMQAVHQRVGLV